MGKPKPKEPQRKPKRVVGLKHQQLTATKKEEQTKPSPFASLPNEMVEKILDLLPLEDKKSARLVSSHWYNVLSRSVQFKLPLNRVTLEELRNQAYAINELSVMLNRVEIPPASMITKDMKGSLLTTKILSFMADSYNYYPDGRLRSHSLDGAGLMTLIKVCRDIHTLRFNFRFLETFKLTDPIRLNNIRLEYLHTLQLKLAYGGQQDASHALLEIKTPQLRNLEVERFRDDAWKGSDADRSVYMALQRCMGRNKGTLKSLKLLNILTNITLANSSPTVFPEDMLLDLGQLNLESLEIQHTDSRLLREQNDTEDWPAADRILNQQSIKFLKLHMNSSDIIQISYILLANCRDTLTKLDLNVKDSEVRFNMETLRHLKCLTNLTFTSDRLVIVDNIFPPTIKYLTWNAPILNRWYLLDQIAQLPALLKLSIGPPGPLLFMLNMFCYDYFGIPYFDFNFIRKTKLQVLTLGRELRTCQGVETRRQFKLRNIDVEVALRLPKKYFNVSHDDENIRIAIQSGFAN